LDAVVLAEDERAQGVGAEDGHLAAVVEVAVVVQVLAADHPVVRGVGDVQDGDLRHGGRRGEKETERNGGVRRGIRVELVGRRS
jgi:hypothetical protein